MNILSFYNTPFNSAYLYVLQQPSFKLQHKIHRGRINPATIFYIKNSFLMAEATLSVSLS